MGGGKEEHTDRRNGRRKEGRSVRHDGQIRPNQTRPGKAFQSPQFQVPCTHTYLLGGGFPRISNSLSFYCTYRSCSKPAQDKAKPSHDVPDRQTPTPNALTRSGSPGYPSRRSRTYKTSSSPDQTRLKSGLPHFSRVRK